MIKFSNFLIRIALVATIIVSPQLIQAQNKQIEMVNRFLPPFVLGHPQYQHYYSDCDIVNIQEKYYAHKGKRYPIETVPQPMGVNDYYIENIASYESFKLLTLVHVDTLIYNDNIDIYNQDTLVLNDTVFRTIMYYCIIDNPDYPVLINNKACGDNIEMTVGLLFSIDWSLLFKDDANAGIARTINGDECICIIRNNVKECFRNFDIKRRLVIPIKE